MFSIIIQPPPTILLLSYKIKHQYRVTISHQFSIIFIIEKHDLMHNAVLQAIQVTGIII
tara:strand:+ start:2858 stop:3034 length:177 start_codon:yes stop_codon:yes gene_type:complete